MTDISVSRTSFQNENRSWLHGSHGTEAGTNPSVTLDISLFAGLYPNGFIPSGVVIAKVTATGLWGPADGTATDGRQTWNDGTVGHLFSSVSVRPGSTKVGGARVVHGFINPDRLPIKTGAGSATAGVRTALRLIHYSA